MTAYLRDPIPLSLGQIHCWLNTINLLAVIVWLSLFYLFPSNLCTELTVKERNTEMVDEVVLMHSMEDDIFVTLFLSFFFPLNVL